MGRLIIKRNKSTL